MDAYTSILIQPVLTEKANSLREDGKYVFRVDSRATKTSIKESVRKMFNVHPVSCTIVNITPKPKRQRGHAGYTATWKKATVRLAPGEKIAVFEGV
jgi:large subunit ribosomal protein L23